MNKVMVLDSTLRDDGYCNEWQFGYDNILKIINGLIEANVDIVECGFLTNKVPYDRNARKFFSMKSARCFIPTNRCGKSFVCMVNYGEYELKDIPDYDGSSFDGIRVTFHKKDMISALKFCNRLKDKG